MSEFKRLRSELFEGGAKVLKAVIEAHRAFKASPVERDFDEKWAREIKDRVSKGLAVSFSWAVADMTAGGRIMRLRMNGNHSSWALAEMLKEGVLPDNLAVHLDTYSVTDEEAAVLLFRQFDCRKSARTKEDISGVYQCFQDAIRECKKGPAKLAVEGVAWYRREVQGLPVASGDDLYRLFEEKRLHPFLAMVDGFLDSKCAELKRVPILAAVYGTWLEDARRAEDFWRLVALGSKRPAADAASDLDDELVRLKTEKSGEKIKAGDVYAKCAKGWAAFLEGARVSSFKVNTKAKGLPVIAA